MLSRSASSNAHQTYKVRRAYYHGGQNTGEARHDTDARRKFAEEFGAAVKMIRLLDERRAGWDQQKAKSQIPSPYKTSVQQHFVSHADALKIPHFQPETQHRNGKTDEYEFNEALFRQWNTYGKARR